MGLFGTQPNAFQTNAFQAPGLVSARAFGTSLAYGYPIPVSFIVTPGDGVIVPPENTYAHVLDRIETVYVLEAPRDIVVEVEIRLVYSPPNTL